MRVRVYTMDTKYKELHREAISNQTGSSLLEIYTSLFPVPIHIIIFIWISIGTNHSKKNNFPTVWMFLFEFIMLVLPTVFNLTLLSDYSVEQFLIYITIFGVAFTWMLLNRNYI